MFSFPHFGHLAITFAFVFGGFGFFAQLPGGICRSIGGGRFCRFLPRVGKGCMFSFLGSCRKDGAVLVLDSWILTSSFFLSRSL